MLINFDRPSQQHIRRLEFFSGPCPYLGMEPIRKTDDGPPIGYVIGPHRYFTVAEGVRIVGTELTCKATLWNSAKAGYDRSTGIRLGVIRVPLLRTAHGRPESNKQYRFLLREDRLLLLRDVYREYKTGKGNMSGDILANMRDAAVRRLRSARPLLARSV